MTRETRPAALDQPPAIDLILPAQFFSPVFPVCDAERRLRLAILADALRYFQRYDGATGRRARALYEDAVDWFASPDRSEPFSFENVCAALGLDPHYVRRGLQRWRETAPARRPRSQLPLGREPVRRNRPRSGGAGGSHRRAA